MPQQGKKVENISIWLQNLNAQLFTGHLAPAIQDFGTWCKREHAGRWWALYLDTREVPVDRPFMTCILNENCELGYRVACLQPKQLDQVGSLEFFC